MSLACSPSPGSPEGGVRLNVAVRMFLPSPYRKPTWQGFARSIWGENGGTGERSVDVASLLHGFGL